MILPPALMGEIFIPIIFFYYIEPMTIINIGKNLFREIFL